MMNIFRLAIILLFNLPLSSAFAADYEKPPSIPFNTAFPDVAIKGEHYSVKSSVPTDGFLTRAVIKSEFGEFVALGPGMLEIRLHEIDALVKLRTFEASDEFQRGAKESAQEKMSSLKQVYDKPKEAAAGISKGVSRFFKRSYRATKTGVQTFNDVVNDRSPGAVEGAGAMLPGSAQSQALPDGESKYKKAAKASGSTAVNILGFDDSRRKLAKRLGVDPYTTNPVLDEKLDEVTWSIFAGDFGIDLATSLIPGSIVITTSGLVTNWDIDRLLRHRAYPLSYQAALTAAMEALGKVDGHKDIMPLALSVQTVDQARFVVNTLHMLQRYHETVQELKKIEVLGTVFATTVNDTIIVAAPVDYVSWSEKLDRFSGRDRFLSQPHELYIAGTMSAMANEQLSKRSWIIHQNSEIFSSISKVK